MVFSSATFLFYFLPLVVTVNLLLKNNRLRNPFLLFASLFFYAWGETHYVFLMIFSIVLNYFVGLAINRYKNSIAFKFLAFGLIANLLLLIHFKYFSFLFESIQHLGILPDYKAKVTHLPIGISFFTFQSISYLVDVFKERAKVQKNLLSLGLYIALFPQLIAGPIIRYHDIAQQIKKRILTLNLFNTGVSRFIFGLSKKILIADPLALIVDNIFLMNPVDIPTSLAWLGIICYSLQIYFDFSGYSDMAIGIGKMLGFSFLENFNYPYISKSIKEFWRRWHISLSYWFRDYLYIPLGGNRKGKLFTYVNLVIVFSVTGLWHGSSWNFLLWGLYHGLFLILERLGLSKILNKLPVLFQHFYTLFVVVIGWVFFRATNLAYTLEYFKTMFGLNNGWDFKPLIYFDSITTVSFIIGLLIACPIFLKLFPRFVPNQYSSKNDQDTIVITNNVKGLLTSLFLVLLLLICIFQIASNSYSPFIYYRF